MSYLKLAIEKQLPVFDILVASAIDTMDIFNGKGIVMFIGDITLKVKKSKGGFKVGGYMIRREDDISYLSTTIKRALIHKLDVILKEKSAIIRVKSLFDGAIRNIDKRGEFYYVDDIRFESLSLVVDELYKPMEIDDESRVMYFAKLIFNHRSSGKEVFDEEIFKDLSVDTVLKDINLGNRYNTIYSMKEVLKDEKLLSKLRLWLTDKDSDTICREIHIDTIKHSLNNKIKEKVLSHEKKIKKIENKIVKLYTYRDNL